MSVIIRLQGLPWSASAMNIRHFFSGLSIPAGGVHIIGGDGGDAFIAFSSDDDARVAMKKNMCPLNGTPVQLFLSSKSEMQSVIDAARSGTAAGMAPATVPAANASLPQNMQQQPMQQAAQQQRQQFQNMANAFQMENQNQNNTSGALAGQQSGEFNPQMQNQFAKNEWHGFQMYGGRGDDRTPQTSGQPQSNFQLNQNQRMPLGQDENRFSGMQDNTEGRGQFNAMQQGTMFPGNNAQFPEGGNSMQPALSASMGMGGMQQQGGDISAQGSMTQKPAFMNKQMPGMQGNIPGSLGMNQSENQTALPGNMSVMGRGQGNFPGQMGMGPNRDAFSNAPQGRLGPGSIPANQNIPVNRGLMNEGIMGRNQMGEQPGVEGMDPMMQKEKLGDKFVEKSGVGPDGRKNEMVPWGGDSQPDVSYPGNQKFFDESNRTDPTNVNRATSNGRPVEQFPFRGDPERARMSRMPDAAESGSDRLMDREAQYRGREMRMGGRFMGDKEQGERFPPGRFADGQIDRYGAETVPSGEDALPSTRYPPDEESLGGLGPGGMRRPGQFPTAGRPDDMRFPHEDRQFPASDRRIPPEDRRMPPRDQGFPEEERFPEGDRPFPPSGRGFPSDERFPADERRFPGDERRPMADDRRFPPGPEGRRLPLDERGLPPEERVGMHPDRMRPEGFGGRRPGDNPFAPDDIRFREREEELRRREAFSRRPGYDDRYPPGHPREGRPDMRPGLQEFEGDEEGRMFLPDRRFPPERGFRGDESERELRGRPGLMDERRAGMSRFDRDRFDRWQEGDEHFQRPVGPRGPENPEFAGMRPAEEDEAMDMDQRPRYEMGGVRRPGFEGRRGPTLDGRSGPGVEGPGMEGMRGMAMEGRGMEGMRGRGRAFEGMRGRGGFEGRGGHGMEGRPAIPSLLDENSFDYGHGSAGRGKPVAINPEDEDLSGADFDNRYPGPAGRGMFDRSQRGRGDPFFGRGRPGPPFGRGRGLDVDRRMEEGMDVDARNVGGRPDAPPLRPLMGDMPKLPDFTIKPGSGKGLLGDAPAESAPKPEMEKQDSAHGDAGRRDIDSRPARRSYDRDRDRDRRSDERRGRDRDDRRSGERSRYRYERERNDRRRSRSRDRSSKDRDSRRSRDKSSSKRDQDRTDSPKRGERSRCIRITNMPINVSYKDIRRFLPYEIPFDGLKVINNELGQRTGEAYVQFRRTDDATRALRKSGEKINGLPATIKICSEDEYSKAVDSFVPSRKEGAPAGNVQTDKADTTKEDKIRYIVQLKNLPLNITKQDIVMFFKGLTIDGNGEAAYIEFDETGVATGNGFVELKTDYDYKKALTLDGSLIGTVAIRVFPGKKEDADDLKSKQQTMFQRAALRTVAGARMMQPRPLVQNTRPGLMGPRPQHPSPVAQNPRPSVPSAQDSSQSSMDTVCVHIQGLPLLATPQDIREFFADCQIAMRGINIAHDSRGKPLGEGFVEFKYKSDFEKAIKKDKTSLGRHIVAVKPIGKKEMMDRLGNARQGGNPPPAQSQPTDDQQQKGPNQVQAPPEEKPQSQMSHAPSIMQGPQNGQGVQPGPKPLLAGPIPPASAANTGITMTPGGSKTIPPGVLNKNWYYVRCQNFPPDISIAEIMNFFQGFRPIGESIRLHYSSEGKPTGNAVVGFQSPDEAQRALQRLNMKLCRQNPVSLHPA